METSIVCPGCETVGDKNLDGNLFCDNKRCEVYLKVYHYFKPTEKAKRDPVGYLFTALDWRFIGALARLAKHGSDKYDDPKDPVPNYQRGVLTRDKSPINHLCNHLTSYQLREPHDHFGSPKWHLVAIAFNAMIEFFHFPAEQPVDNNIDAHQ